MFFFFCFFSWHSQFGTWFWFCLEQNSRQERDEDWNLNKYRGKGAGAGSLCFESSWENTPECLHVIRRTSRLQILSLVSSFSYRSTSTCSPVFTLFFSFTQGLQREDADPMDAAPVTIFTLLSSLPSSLGSYCDSGIVKENVSPTFFIVIPRSGRGNWLAAVKPLSLFPPHHHHHLSSSTKTITQRKRIKSVSRRVF